MMNVAIVVEILTIPIQDMNRIILLIKNINPIYKHHTRWRVLWRTNKILWLDLNI